MRRRQIRTWAITAILCTGLGTGVSSAGLLDNVKKKLDPTKVKETLKAGMKKAGAWAGSLGGLADKLEKKCALEGGRVPLAPAAATGDPLACPADGKCANDVTEKLKPLEEPLVAAF